LYSDKEVFLREPVSDSCYAIDRPRTEEDGTDHEEAD
jgi:HSP90 family molecular chaperone